MLVIILRLENCFEKLRKYSNFPIVKLKMSIDKIQGLQKLIKKDAFCDFFLKCKLKCTHQKLRPVFRTAFIFNFAILFFKKKNCVFVTNCFNSFFVLSILRKVCGKFIKLLKNIISEPLFLFYSYIQIKQQLGIEVVYQPAKFFTTMQLNWFYNLSKQLKNISSCKNTILFNLSKRNLINITQRRFQFVLLQQVLYTVFKKIWTKQLVLLIRPKILGTLEVASIHSALNEIKHSWHGILWLLEFNISQVFTAITRNILITLLKKQIKDEALFSLLYQLFKLKIWEHPTFFKTSWESNQHAFLKTLLKDIYMLPLDIFIEFLCKKYECGVKKKCKFIKRFFFKYANTQRLAGNNYIRIKYIRYGTSFLLGLNSSKKFASKLKREISFFVKSHLQLILTKKLITVINAYTQKANFLGMLIYAVKTPSFTCLKPQAIEKKRRILKRMRARAHVIDKQRFKTLSGMFWKNFQKIIAIKYFAAQNLKILGQQQAVNTISLAVHQRSIRSIVKTFKKTLTLSLRRTIKIRTFSFKNPPIFKLNYQISVKKLRPFLSANLNIIYALLKKKKIITQTLLPCSRIYSLLWSDTDIILYFRVLSLKILIQYQCSDNFCKVKAIVAYSIRMSLVLTLKHKHKWRNTSKVFTLYGPAITKKSSSLGIIVSFFSFQELKFMCKKFLLTLKH